jgi:trehalose utilization protein
MVLSTDRRRNRSDHMPIRVLVWNEGRHERQNPQVAAVYPQGIHGAIAAHLATCPDMRVATATLDCDEDHGCSEQRLGETDVLAWWGHMAHHEVRDAVVERIHGRVLAGMGLIVLHSAHMSRIFQRLMGTTCNLKWREADEREILWVTRPGHPIVRDIDDNFILPTEEMYGEYFDIPEPMETILISTFAGGEVFRSGITYQRGAGRIFYFRPGHETYPTYYDRNVLKVIENAVRWASPTMPPKPVAYGNRRLGWMDSVRL